MTGISSYDLALVAKAREYAYAQAPLNDDGTYPTIEDHAAEPRIYDVPGSLGSWVRIPGRVVSADEMPLYRELIRLIESGNASDNDAITYHTAAKAVRNATAS